MPETWNALNGQEVAKQICELLGINAARCTRVIVDIPAGGGSFVKIYVEMIGDNSMLELKWNTLEVEVKEKEVSHI